MTRCPCRSTTFAHGLCGGTPAAVETRAIRLSRITIAEAVVPRASIVVTRPLWRTSSRQSPARSCGSADDADKTAAKKETDNHFILIGFRGSWHGTANNFDPSDAS